jgi:hypothetical protein
MRKAVGLVLAGLGAVALTGAAVAASQDSHTINVSLPDGSIAHVQYVGSVAPKVTISPAPDPFAAFGLFDPSALGIQREFDAMMKEMDAIARTPIAGAPGLNVAAYGNAPAASNSITIETTINGGRTCTRRTEVISQGSGKAPKVVSSLSGDCGSAPPLTTPRANST